MKPPSFSSFRDLCAASSLNSPATAKSTKIGSAQFLKFSPFWVIEVEGYDTSLPADDIKSALTNHFGSCGSILRTDLVDSKGGPTIKIMGRASIVIVGDDADKKALELNNGSEVAGGKLVVEVVPYPKLQVMPDIPFD